MIEFDDAMRNKNRKPAVDADNPEWTESEFARARPANELLPKQSLAAFKRTRGPQKSPTKIPIAIRLSRDVVEHFKAGGAGWQSRIDDALKRIVRQPRRKVSASRRLGR
jgi:uncharacterized protein (DUF4415 family)